MTINTTIPALCCSAALPDAISITTTQNIIGIKVKVGGSVEWTTELYSFQGEAVLYDIRTVIEAVLRAQAAAFGVCNIVVVENGQEYESSAFSVVMADVDIPSVGMWLQSHFLTTMGAFAISRTGKQYLHWYAAQGEATTYKVTARYKSVVQGVEMEMETVWTQSTAANVNEGVYTVLIDVAAIEEHFNKTLLSFTVERGTTRKMTFFITDDVPSLAVKFINLFNVMEIAELFVDSNTKVKMEASEAKALRSIVKYDFNRSEETEVQSNAISLETAKWLAQMVASRKAYKRMEDNTWQEILIDGESEISDKTAAENTVKFTYKMARQ